MHGFQRAYDTAALLNPDRAGLKRVGAAVRIARAGYRVYKFPTEEAEIFALGGFLSASECERLVAMIDAIKPSHLHDQSMPRGSHLLFGRSRSRPCLRPAFRADRRPVGDRSALRESIRGSAIFPDRSSSRTMIGSIPISLIGSSKTNAADSAAGPRWRSQQGRGKGHTFFPEIEAAIEPSPALLIWNNALPDGTPNEPRCMRDAGREGTNTC